MTLKHEIVNRKMATIKDLALKYKYTGDPHFLHIIYLRIDPFILFHTWRCFFQNDLHISQLSELYQCACVGTYSAIRTEIKPSRDHKFIYMDLRRGLREGIGEFVTNQLNYKKRLTKEPNARRIDHHIRSRFPTSEEIELQIDAADIKNWFVWKKCTRRIPKGVWAYYEHCFVIGDFMYKDDGGYSARRLKGTTARDKIRFLKLVDEARKYFLTEKEYADYTEQRDERESKKDRRAYKGLTSKYRGIRGTRAK